MEKTDIATLNWDLKYCLTVVVLSMEWWDNSLENVHFIAHYLFLQALNPVVKDHGKHVALVLSPLPSPAVHDILLKEIESINEGNN